MSLDDDVRILSGVGLFEGFTHEQLRLLAFGAEPVHMPAARVLYREGDMADTAFVVVKGRIELSRQRGSQRARMGEAGVGAILGELALIADASRLTDAATAQDSDLIRLERKQFRRILDEFPEIAAMLHRRIADELQRMVRDIEALAPRFGAEPPAA